MVSGISLSLNFVLLSIFCVLTIRFFSVANILLLSLMSWLAPLEWQIVVTSVDLLRDVPSKRYGHCRYDCEQAPYLVVLVVINLGILVSAISQAHKARNLSTEFAESQYIFKALLSILMVLFICGPVFVMTVDNPNLHVFTGSAVVFIWSTMCLLWIFIPKIQYSREHKRQPPRSTLRISGLDGVSSLRAESAESGRSLENDPGERILSRLSIKQLIRENDTLRLELAALRTSCTTAMYSDNNKANNTLDRDDTTEREDDYDDDNTRLARSTGGFSEDSVRADSGSRMSSIEEERLPVGDEQT